MSDNRKNSGVPVYDLDALRAICPMFDGVLEVIASKTNNFSRLLCRSDFTPNDFIKYLPNIVLSEFTVDDGGNVSDIFCRVSGSWVASYYGELSGKFLKDHVIPEINDRTISRFQLVYDERNVLGFETQVLSEVMEYLSVRALFIPVSDDGETHNMMLAFIDNSKEIAKDTLSY